MEIEAAKVIGAGLAVIGVIGSGIGIGNIFSSFIEAVGRNPAVAIHMAATAASSH